MGSWLLGRPRPPAKVASTIFLLCVILLSCVRVEVLAVTDTTDVTALNALGSAWGVDSSLNWNGDPCDDSWTGVSCNFGTTPATVIKLTLMDNKIRGTLPSAIGGLTSLVNLELSRNKGLTGPLPKELGSLVNLQYLSIQWCSLSGPIPVELGDLPNLIFLGLNGNQLSSSIPSSFGKLTNLTWLDVSTNNLTGAIPVSSSSGSNGIGLDNMTSIKHFHFNENLLSGPIPAEIFLLPFLIHIIFDHNGFTSLPTGVIGNAPSLIHMVLENNRLNGSIPQDIGSVRTLQRLTLNNNLFSGELPDFSNLTALEYLDVSNNQLSQQSFPSWVNSMSNLGTLNLAQDNIVGPINSSVFNISQLQSLNLSHNQITGQLDFTGNSTSHLQSVDVTQNSISGFSGEPEFNGVLLQGVQIMLTGNPVCFNPYLSFSNFSCGTNSPQFFWTPSPNASCSSVNCKNNEQLNRKTCACAYPLHITVILTSPTFSNLTDATALNLETEIADQMTSGQFITLDPSQVVIDSGSNTGNGQYQLNLLFFPLVGDSLSSNNQTEIVSVFNQRRITLAEGPFQVPGHPFINSRGAISLSPGAIAGIVIGVCVLLTGLVTALYAIRQKIRADKAVANHPFASWGAGGKELGDAPKLKGARWFYLAELKLATDDWSKKNELGRGGYGIVYKGILKSGDIVAIKRAQGKSMQGAAEFKNEIELLSRVHHRNLVGLLGFCYEDGEQALIYEYMSNGTLRDYLYGQSRAPFSWQERLNIALGSARGIAYLHDHANPPIIHRDVKTSNILLNNRKAAKVADFGLSKLAPEEGEMRVYSANVKGTMGYLDPEYYTTFKLTDKSDVYSFGIVLIELLTARPPIVNGKFVVREVKTALDRGGLVSLRPLLEPAVQDLSDAELEAFLNVALKCVEDSSADRESIAQVVKQLEDLGANSNPNGDMHSFDIEFGSLKKSPKKFDDDDVVFPSSAGAEKGANGSSAFHYSGNSSSWSSDRRTSASRLRPPVARQRAFERLFQSVDQDSSG